ncbi:MAG: hypothetical protein GY756_17755, partial [bacterium]|nr:hypothetical protein [bacterium]
MSEKGKIHIFYIDMYSERNIITSGIIEKLKEKGYEVEVSFDEVFRNGILYKILDKWRKFIFAIQKYRFIASSKFAKYQIKKKHRNDMTLDKFDRLNYWLGFPFPESKIILNFFYRLFLLTPNTVNNSFKPDLVIVFGCQDVITQNVIKLCNKKNIPALTVVSSWDHLTHRGRVIKSDQIRYFLTWNDIQKHELIKYHYISQEKIKKVGALQFDLLFKEREIPEEPKVLHRKYNIPENYKIVLLPADSYRLGISEPRIVSQLILQKEKIESPFVLIIRPNPVDVNKGIERFDKIPESKNVIFAPLVKDKNQDRKNMSALLRYSDVILTGCTSPALEAMFYDTPVVHIAIEEDERKENPSYYKEYFYSDHYKNIMKHNASSFVETYNEMFDAINTYCNNPEYKKEERLNVVKE